MRSIIIIALLTAMIVRVPEAPATVAEQRARLPPAAECESEIAGRWKAHIYSEATGYRWYIHILEIRHDPNDKTQLVGEMTVDTWRGDPDDAEPPMPCQHRYRGKSPAKGTFVDGQVVFSAESFELVEEVCGSFYGYNPDSFSGRIEPERQEFQSVNNDGGAAVNEPAVFRRIGCFDNNDQPNKPAGPVTAPAFYPKRRSSSAGGCT
jgi:hypothetical protein